VPDSYVATTLCLKNVPHLTCYNRHIHCSITILFGTNVIEKVGNQNVVYFPTLPNWCFCTTWKTGNPKTASFHLNAACLFYQNTHNIKILPGYS